MRDGWAAAQRRRWSGPRIAVAIALHALLLATLNLAIDRVDVSRRGADRTTTLLAILLPTAPPPVSHALPVPLPRPVRQQPPLSLPRPPEPRPPQAAPQSITQPAPSAPAVAASPQASSSAPDLRFLDGAATRLAIREAAHGRTLAGQANQITSTAQTAGERLAAGVESAHKADCMKAAGGMGLLALPVLLAAEVLDKCAHKL